MPTYEYQCGDCGSVFEVIQKIVEPPIDECPNCKGHSVKRLISATAFHLKGSGWYKTDYAAPSGASGGSTKKSDGDSSSATDSSAPVKTEAKSETPAPAKTETKSETAKPEPAKKPSGGDA